MACYKDIFYHHGLPGDDHYITGIARQTEGAKTDIKKRTSGPLAHLQGTWRELYFKSRSYYTAKWACSDPVDPATCAYRTPFNNASMSLKGWALNVTRRNEVVALLRAQKQEQAQAQAR